MSEKSVDCRKQAEECLRLAHYSQNREAKATFELLAETWMKLAADRLALVGDERISKKRLH
jgi:hypothetical protein